MEPITITNENFEQEVVNSDVPVLVDIWASWCGPCKMLSPIVDEVAKTADGFKVGKINADEEGELAEKFGVTSIPTLLVFKDGKVANQSVGFIPKDKVLALQKAVAKRTGGEGPRGARLPEHLGHGRPGRLALRSGISSKGGERRRDSDCAVRW